jgi:hypothetical protein
MSSAHGSRPAGGLVYVVRADIAPDCGADYDAWLEEHVPAMLRQPGFTGADVLRALAPADTPEDGSDATPLVRAVAYRVQSAADWRRFEQSGAAQMRSEAFARFGERVRFSVQAWDQTVHFDPRSGRLERCRNCGATLLGTCCSSCGQRGDVHVPTTHELVHEALEGFTHSDSRLWRSLRLLWFKPGFLTREFIAGRRETYLPPIRLYLVVSVLCYFVLGWSHPVHDLQGLNSENIRVEVDCGVLQSLHPGRSAFVDRMRHGCESTLGDGGAGFVHLVAGALPKALFLFLPAIAFGNGLLYWRPRRRYAEHLLFFVHLHTFFFSALTVKGVADKLAEVWPSATPVTTLLAAGIALWMPLYTVVAMKRVFGSGWALTFARAAALALIYAGLAVCTAVGLVLYAMLQL